MKTKKASLKNGRAALALALLAALLASTAANAVSGGLDTTFGTGGVVITDFGGPSDGGMRLRLSSDGSKIYALGTMATGSAHRPVIVRYFNNGIPDPGFSDDGKLILDAQNFTACDFDLQLDGKVIVAGATARNNFALVRYLSDGALDTAFGAGGIATLAMDANVQIWCSDMLLQPDQKIIVFGFETLTGGVRTDFFVARFNADGSPDETFVAHGFNIIDKTYFPGSQFNYGRGAALQPDGKIILAGGMQDYEGDSRISLARLNPDGFLDTSFGANGKGTTTEVLPGYFMHNSVVTLQADGKIVVAGTTSDEGENRDLALARFHSNGTPDSSFGIVTSDFGEEEEAAAILLQKDGKIILAGTTSTAADSRFLLARYDSNGSLDSSFGSAGMLTSDITSAPDRAEGAALQIDGKALIVGSGGGNLALVRYEMGTTGAQPMSQIFISNPAQDGWILESAESSNAGGARDSLSTTFNAGDDNKDRQYRSILSFQTKSLPDNAFIVSAQLKIKRQSLAGTNPFSAHGALLVEIRQGAFNQSLALEAADFSAPASSSIMDSFAPLTSTWFSANLAAPNLARINLFGPTQFRIRFTLDDNDDRGADYIKFFSGNSTEANRPGLIITYYMP